MLLSTKRWKKLSIRERTLNIRVYQPLREQSLLVMGCHIVIRVRSCDIILNSHASTEDRRNGTKDIIYEELEPVFGHFPKYHTKILLGDFNAKLGREDTVICSYIVNHSSRCSGRYLNGHLRNGSPEQ
jgi:hypothetical protein